MRTLLRFLASGFLLVAAPVACVTASPEAASTGQDAGTRADAATTDAESKDAEDPACTAFDSTVQTGLDGQRAKQKLKYATIATWTERCGTHVYVSGDENVAPITEQAFWRIGSVTKTYVAATILRFVEQGKLSLDDTMDTWLPTFPRGAQITVRHLLNHTSGIYNYTETQKFRDSIGTTPQKELSPEDLFAMANEQPPTNEPGAAFAYSNTNYIALGRILELVTGEKAHVVVRREAMVPAGLTQTFLDGPETVPGPFAPGYQSGKDVTKKFNLSIAWTAGSMATTPGDLILWLRALYIERKVLGPSSYTLMTTSFPNAGYGLGAILLPPQSTMGAGQGVGHSGSIYGYQTQAFAFPETKFAVVSITADTNGDPNALSIIGTSAFKALRAAP